MKRACRKTWRAVWHAKFCPPCIQRNGRSETVQGTSQPSFSEQYYWVGEQWDCSFPANCLPVPLPCIILAPCSHLLNSTKKSCCNCLTLAFISVMLFISFCLSKISLLRAVVLQAYYRLQQNIHLFITIPELCIRGNFFFPISLQNDLSIIPPFSFVAYMTASLKTVQLTVIFVSKSIIF